jgi:diguanylate cyclase (GGDEF)-like protein/PAS domain S-box-containing protein
MDSQIYKTILESLPMGVYLVDCSRKILWWNHAAEKITGFLAQDVIGRRCSDSILMHCDENNRLLCKTACPLAKTIQDGEQRDANVFLRHKEGQRVPVRIQAVAIRNEEGVIVGAAESFEERLLPDPDELKPRPVLQDQLDGVTNIPDHRSTLEHLRQSVAAFEADHMPFAVLRIAADKLNELGASRGRGAVDAMLRALARTLAKGLRPTDIVGRWSDDGFLAIVTHCPPDALTKVADLLTGIVRQTAIPWWGDWVSVTISTGAVAMREGETVDSLLARCEHGLVSSIGAGGDRATLA